MALAPRLDDNLAPMDMHRRFLALQAMLEAHQDLWRPQPFHGRDLVWRVQRPDLARAVDALDEAAVEQLEAAPETLVDWLVSLVPTLEPLPDLIRLPTLPWQALEPVGPHFGWHIPGRKQAQIEAFAGHVIDPQAPILEWCAGKGHLGRRLAVGHGQAVTSLEIDPVLVGECRLLAQRAQIEQHAVCADALQPDARRHVAGAHVVALHACGELHRTLIRHARVDGAHGYSIAPCCYHRGAEAAYAPLSTAATLDLDASALRLAVTETVTAVGREQRMRRRAQAFKLGFVALRAALEGGGYRSFRPVPAGWSSLGFEGFCRQLAEREGVTLPASVDWSAWEAAGVRRQTEVAGDSLVRHAFRRAIELWLVGDLALALEGAGFEVSAGVFCERQMTPRNVLIQARY